MASTIQLKTGTSGAPSNLTNGEVAINVNDGLFYYGSGSGNVTQQLDSFTHITASGNISSSGQIESAQKFMANGLTVINNDGTTTVFGTTNKTEIDGTSIKLDAAVTASVISASGTIFTGNIKTPDHTAGNVTGTPITIKAGRGFGSGATAGTLFLRTGQGMGTGLGGDITLQPGGGGSALSKTSGSINLTSTKININGPITASGNINTTGIYQVDGVNAIDYASSTHLFGSNTSFTKLRSTKGIEMTAPVTASSNISASGNVVGVKGQFSQIEIDGESALNTADSATTGQVFADSQITKIEIGKAGTVNNLNLHGNNTHVIGHITSSGNISSSGNVIADFYDAKTSGTGYKLSGAKALFVDSGTVFGRPTTDTIITGSTIQLGRGAITHVTASGNISSSGTITALSASVSKLEISDTNIVGQRHILFNSGIYINDNPLLVDNGYFGSSLANAPFNWNDPTPAAFDSSAGTFEQVVDITEDEHGSKCFFAPFAISRIEVLSSWRVAGTGDDELFWVGLWTGSAGERLGATSGAHNTIKNNGFVTGSIQTFSNGGNWEGHNNDLDFTFSTPLPAFTQIYYGFGSGETASVGSKNVRGHLMMMVHEA